MISVNDISPQLVQSLIDRIKVLEDIIYDYDGKGIRQQTVNGDRLIVKTVNGDRITGGVIEGSLIKTINPEADNSGDYAYLQKQWLEICLNNVKLMDIGIVDNDSGNPVIHFYHPDGSNYFTIWGNNTDNFVSIGGFNTDVKGEGVWSFDNVRINGSEAAPAPFGGLSGSGDRIYLNPNDTSRLYIQRDSDGALSIHDDAYTYAKISADAITWF